MVSYDGQGRISKVTDPKSLGTAGEYTVEDQYEYTVSTVPSELNQKLFKVTYKRIKTPLGGSASTITETESYYDDHRNLQLAKNWDYDRLAWVTATYGYNTYGQLIWSKDANNNQTSYLTDEWDRLQKVSNVLSKQEQISNPLKYTGEYYDEESGLYYLRASYYNPTYREVHFEEILSVKV